MKYQHLRPTIIDIYIDIYSLYYFSVTFINFTLLSSISTTADVNYQWFTFNGSFIKYHVVHKVVSYMAFYLGEHDMIVMNIAADRIAENAQHFLQYRLQAINNYEANCQEQYYKLCHTFYKNPKSKREDIFGMVSMNLFAVKIAFDGSRLINIDYHKDKEGGGCHLKLQKK